MVSYTQLPLGNFENFKKINISPVEPSIVKNPKKNNTMFPINIERIMGRIPIVTRGAIKPILE